MKKYKYPYKISFFKFLFNSSEITRNPIPFHNRFFEKSNDDSFSIKPFFNKPILLTRDAEIAKQVLQKKHKSFEKSKLQTQFLSKYVGYGLLTSTGTYWLKQRRLIQPAFHKEKINNLLALINETIKEEVKKITPDKTTDLYSIMNVLAFKVVANSLFDFSADINTLNRLQDIIAKLQLFIVREIRQPHKRFWYVLTGDKQRHLELVKESRAIINTIIEERRTSKAEHDDLLDMLLKATYEDGTSMTNEQLIDEILILFVAGHETTANALTFTFFLLANNKEALNKAEKEAKHFNDDNLNFQSFSELDYTKNCVEESLRLYPSAWITDRVSLKDETIGNYKIPKGTLIGISIYELHRNPAYWHKPEEFIPERFSKKSDKDNFNSYMPFGAGPRFCIGNNFAMYEMMLTVKEVLKNFTIKTNKTEVSLKPLITLKPVGVELIFTSKKGND